MISKAKIKFMLYAGSAVILALLAYGAVMACWDFCDGSAPRHEREGGSMRCPLSHIQTA